MKIEKGIPIPKGSPQSAEKYNFLNSMEVGDSIVIEKQERNRLYSYGRSYQYKFISRTLQDGKQRVWLKEKPEMEGK